MIARCRRIVLPGRLAATTACTVSWRRAVGYSREPVAPSVSVEADLYGVVADRVIKEWKVTALAPNGAPPIELAAFVIAPYAVIQSSWADTLKLEVQAALADPHLGTPADDSLVQAAFRSRLPAGSPSHANGTGLTQLRLSNPGFNADSTIAAIRVGVLCGPLCGEGAIWLLARRPGFRWRVWRTVVTWIS
jgi:hypothetical protein